LLPFNQNPKTHKISAGRSTLPNKQVLYLGGLCFIAFMAEGSMLDWSAEYLHSNLDYEASLAGIGYALFSIAMAIGRFIGDRLIQRFGSMQIFQIGSLVAASGFLIVVNLNWGYLELLGFCLIGLGASNVVPILFSSSGRLPEISSNTALTTVTTCGYVGLLLGPALIGFLAQATNLSFALAAIAFLLIAIGTLGRAAIPATMKAVRQSVRTSTTQTTKTASGT
jgi:MFS family permease